MATEKNMLKLKSPGVTTAEDLPKVGVNYYGIEFTRNTSNNGGTNGYHKMIGTEEMLAELPVHNQCRVAAVINAKVTQTLNQTNFFKDVDGKDVDLAGANGEDFMFALPTDKSVYAILGGTHETYERWLFGNEPFSYGGDVAQLIRPFAESVDHSTRIDNMQRCVYDPNTAGSMGTQNACITEGFDIYKSSAGFPRTSTTRFNYELYARNKNSDNTKNVPYYNCQTLDLSFFLGLIYVETRTKFLTNVFGDAISSNTTPSASNWDGNRVSGVKIIEADGTVHYITLSNTSLYVDSGDGTTVSGTRIWDLIEGGAYPMLQIMEAQRDISNGCVNGTFESVTCPDGTKIQGLDDGVMTGVWVKTMTGKIKCAFTADTAVAECDIEVKLCEPIWRGNTWKAGDIWWERSGTEVLLHNDADGNPVENILYQIRKVEDMTTDTDVTDKEKEEDWEFTKTYERLGDIGTTNRWCTEQLISEAGVTHPTAKGTGGGKTTYDGAYTSVTANTTTANIWRRKWAVFGGGANYSTAGWRYSNSDNQPSYSTARYGGGFGVILDNADA
ncbi:MAG: hypothetical protein LUD72_00855 [Bacteroidales bacterium]|nr:hypothetical protein [Bacteroidales bacterium]